MADENMSEEKVDNGNGHRMGNYASRHPRRMASGMFFIGTALGASIMAAKKNREKNTIQRFIDQIGR